MKTKENCFKSFNDVKVILNKKKTKSQLMCAGDIRASIAACKDLKINIKTLKILVILLILFFRVFRPFGLFTLCHHKTKFSSPGTSVLLSYQKQLSGGAP